ncbi:unnamed protein product, partial [Mesorhabditis belari]|uniref:Serpentine receptor class gamma n=1 Tax=Mesorhabditis belari TaxID=2138241 RepID=A0AAF3EQF8_9BILA
MSLVLFLVYCIYGIPSTILYLIVIYTIVVKRRTIFAGSFYLVYLNLLVVDLVTYLNTYINLKPREIPGIAEYFVDIEFKIPPYRFFIMLSFACYHLQASKFKKDYPS